MNRVHHLVALAVLGSMTACATFRCGDVDVRGWPPEAEKKLSMSFTVTGKVILNGRSLPTS